MKGTIFKLKSKLRSESVDEYDSSIDLSNATSCDGDQDETLDDLEHSSDTRNEGSSDSHDGSESIRPSEDLEKDALMSTLKLQSTNVSVPSLKPHEYSTFQREVFNWNDANMWKAMAQHPLFSKYMELQSQLYELYETIRLDCKKAACEKAFSALVKDNNYTSNPVLSKTLVTSTVLHKRRGRAPLNKKRGRPRKVPVVGVPLKEERKGYVPNLPKEPSLEGFSEEGDMYECWKCDKIFAKVGWFERHYQICHSTSLKNGNGSAPVRMTRRSSDGPIFTCMPRWRCEKCSRQFAGRKWLEKHQLTCTVDRFSRSIDLKTFEREGSEEGILTLNHAESLNSPTVKSSMSASPRTPSQGHFLSPVFKMEIESPQSALSRSPLTSISPLAQKVDARFCNSENASLNNGSDDVLNCNSAKDSVKHCANCERQFVSLSLLEKHWEKCQPRANNSNDDTGDKIVPLLDDNEEVEESNVPYRSDDDLNDGDENPTYEEGRADCKNCGKTFRRKKGLKRHEAVCHLSSKKKFWQCLYCLRGFLKQAHFKRHQSECTKRKSAESVHRCENCSMMFSTQKKLLKHQAFCCPDLSNQMLKILKCMNCSLVFPSYKKQLKHRAVCCPDSDTNSKVCQKCFKVFIMKDRMDAHRLKCSGMR